MPPHVDHKAPGDLADEELACRAQAGSSACFEELVRRLEGRLLRFLLRRTRTPQDAEDLLQETFLRGYQRLGSYNPAWKITTWLFTIASRLAISHGRKRRAVALPRAACVPAVGDDALTRLARQEEKEALWATAQSTLSENQHTVLWLRYAEGMSVKEIARVMGKTRTHVKVLLYRARSALGRRLEQAEPTPASGVSERRSGDVPATVEGGG